MGDVARRRRGRRLTSQANRYLGNGHDQKSADQFSTHRCFLVQVRASYRPRLVARILSICPSRMAASADQRNVYTAGHRVARTSAAMSQTRGSTYDVPLTVPFMPGRDSL